MNVKSHVLGMISYMILYVSPVQISPVHMQPWAGSNATRYKSNAGPQAAHSLRLSVLLGIKIGLKLFISPCQA